MSKYTIENNGYKVTFEYEGINISTWDIVLADMAGLLISSDYNSEVLTALKNQDYENWVEE
jgi:hypothetical protein